MIEGIPYVTESLVEALEALFPPRCLKVGESVEQHLRYAGKVELIALLRANCLASPKALELNEDDDALIDEMVEHEAARQQEKT